MLDYDSMRSKVKRLVEKPDKDPAKLPRTEKEAEMVSCIDLREAASPFSPRFSSDEPDLSIPSPPKALNRPEIEALKRLQREEDAFVSTHSGLTRSPSLLSNRVSALRQSEDRQLLLSRSPSTASQISHSPSSSGVHTREPSRSSLSHPALRPQNTPRTPTPRKPIHTPFLHPSELEDLIRPVREQYIREQTDTLKQAKAAYDVLNEQLTNELPQLIDLRYVPASKCCGSEDTDGEKRVPYLDPSFEALVKIQLRFCAEAYSRMAQVQQYVLYRKVRAGPLLTFLQVPRCIDTRPVC